MRLTTKGRYAVTAMLDLSMHDSVEPVSLSEISQRQDISLPYLEQLFSKLKKNQLVESVRGPGGGYRLKQSAANTYISQIVDAVDETVDATNCKGQGDCQQGEMCLSHHLWQDLTGLIHNFLSGISLQSLINRRDISVISQRQDQAEHRVIELN